MASACTYVGNAYYNGKRGVQRDTAEAAKWYKEALRFAPENARANYDVADCFRYGYGGFPKDNTEAFRLYKKAAELGDDYAFIQVAFAYDYGEGILPDTQLAITWYEKAMQVKNEFTDDAYVYLSALYYFGKPDLPPNYEKAFALDRKAACRGHPRAQYNLGCAYHEGAGTIRSLDLAIEWYTKCLEQGKEDSEDAKSNLAQCYREKSTVYYHELVSSSNPSLSLEARGVLTSDGRYSSFVC